MAPKSKGKGEKKPPAGSSVASASKAPVNYIFPPISEKEELECTVVMEDQILIIEASPLRKPDGRRSCLNVIASS